jgi:hypothetical protein
MQPVQYPEDMKCGSFSVGLDSDGAVTSLVDVNGIEWADSQHPLMKVAACNLFE